MVIKAGLTVYINYYYFWVIKSFILIFFLSRFNCRSYR